MYLIRQKKGFYAKKKKGKGDQNLIEALNLDTTRKKQQTPLETIQSLRANYKAYANYRKSLDQAERKSKATVTLP